MGYITKDSQNFIVSKLTDVGRRKISQGKFKISYFQIGDSEMVYNMFFSPSINEPNFLSDLPYTTSLILEPSFNSHNNTGEPESNKSGSKFPFYLSETDTNGTTYGIPFEVSSVSSIYNSAGLRGFFSGSTSCSFYFPNPTSKYSYNSRLTVPVSSFAGNATVSPTSNTTCLNYSNATISANTYVTFFITNQTDSNLCDCLSSCNPILTYKTTNFNANTISIDKSSIKMNYFTNLSNKARVFFYSNNLTYFDYSTPLNYYPENILNFESICNPETGDTKVWNMNITWSESPAGTQEINYSYDEFLSVNYLSAKQYYGYSTSDGQMDTSGTYYYDSYKKKIFVSPEEQKTIAIVHFSNNNIINFYGEKFATESVNTTGLAGQARNFKISIPWLMWHKNSSCCSGTIFYIDPPGFDTLDLLEPNYIKSTKNPEMNEPGIRYFHLYDTNANSLDGGRPNRVGKVFPDDKIIIFDDEEIVAAMSYASHRNFTLPAPRVQLINSRESEGVLTSENECMWVTYILSNNSNFNSTNTFIWKNLHCNYYQKINGPTLSCDVPNQDVVLKFGGDFNCMQQPTQSNYTSGWFARVFAIICQKTKINERPNPTEWKIIDYTSSTTRNADGFINPSSLINKNFIITKNNYDNAAFYNLNNYLEIPKKNDNSSSNRINFGEEFLFYGTVETDIESTIYEMRYLINLPFGQLSNSSQPLQKTNPDNKYITEIGLFDEDKNLLVYSKLQTPQKRQGIQQLVVKLDF